MSDRRRFTRDEYDRLIQLGSFQGEKLELLRGELVKMFPTGSRHSWADGPGAVLSPIAFPDVAIEVAAIIPAR